MKRMMIAVLTAFMALPAFAQEEALKDLPGYIDFGQLSSAYGEPAVNITIGGTVLNFVGAMAAADDPEAAAVFNKLKGVRVSTYKTDGDSGAAMDQLNSVKSKLQSADWEPVVQVNDGGEQVQIFLKIAGEAIDGLVLMAVDDEEAVFINIIGSLDPSELSQVMDNFDVDLDNVDINLD
ncbi:MAG: DUF4252 domain-containing protein [Xanthomonadales bacterium]|nr:DUF4252 domain-containing protein [Xanthomonadales bacterium]NIS44208.1 DUF4252 domain-containing protein [Desulfuromonadales bacterium]NIX13920.1 DUF4252 domain-containing protein [Xanthomonadales bacterium]